MFRSATIPTLFCIDARAAKHAAVCIVSLLENNPGAFFDLVVVSAGDLGSEAAKLRRTLAAYPNCALKTVRFEGRAGLRLPARVHYAIGDYMRLWMQEFFPASVAKILCLGSDMIIAGDIGGLWRAELGEAVLGAVTIPGSTRGAALGIAEEHGYFDTGVLVVDLARWRCENIPGRLIGDLAAHNDKPVETDRDLLNLSLFDRRRALSPVYNALSSFFSDSPANAMSAADIAALRAAARIIHFDDPSKPWSYLCRHPRRADYWHYLGHTEWRDDEPEDRNLANWTRKTFGPLLPGALRTYIRARASVPAE
ncbi:MAG TPA: glycosyltransferase [Stellaceae bacterium]|jgi:lipopolysaccharide biosynthesis glycosyltransferase